MKEIPVTHRVVTFLTREELEFLDKLERDMMFSTGTYISRSKIIADLVELLSSTAMNAIGLKDERELERKMIESIAKITPAQKNGGLSLK